MDYSLKTDENKHFFFEYSDEETTRFFSESTLTESFYLEIGEEISVRSSQDVEIYQ